MDQDAPVDGGHEHDKIPKDGAAINIITPANGDEISSGDMIMVKVEAEGFDLSADDNHWHLYVDGELVEMIEGNTRETMIHQLDAGEYTIMTTILIRFFCRIRVPYSRFARNLLRPVTFRTEI